MARDIDHDVVAFMKKGNLAGHFEFTTREVADGIEVSYTAVDRAMIRLSNDSIVEFRTRGAGDRPAKHYYLKELKELAKKFLGKGTS